MFFISKIKIKFNYFILRKMKQFIVIFLLFNLIIHLTCQDVKLGKTIEEKLKEEDLDNYEEDHSMDDKLAGLVNEYVQEQKWTPEQQLDKETFKKMFVYVIQRGALRQGNSGILKKLADKIIEKQGETIVVKDLTKYFNIKDLTLTYSQLLHPQKNTDL